MTKTIHQNPAMNLIVILFGLVLMLPQGTYAAKAPAPNAAPITTETIVFVRHGEKPNPANGQLNCQGLNRSLALPDVLLKKFGNPNELFAPNPAVIVEDNSNYVRPLATIEPTAIRLNKAVNTLYGFNDITGIERALMDPTKHASAVLFVAWEHVKLVDLVKSIIGGVPPNVKVIGWKDNGWPDSDYDSIWIMKIQWQANTIIGVTFSTDKEGLDGQKKCCPGSRTTDCP